jgi:arylformamidase
MAEITRSAANAADSATSAYWEHEYNPRVRVTDPQRYFDAWSQRAAQTRAQLPALLDVAYGPDPRQKLDLFRAPDARGTLVFIHGGYWRVFGRESFSWVAEEFVRAGISVAIPSYPLCPAVRIADIVRSVSAAVESLQRDLLTPAEQQKTVLVGHSAGAHVAACLMAAATNTGAKIGGVVAISGLFDLLPLLGTNMLSGMGWEPAELHAVSPLYMAQPATGSVLLAVGGDESSEFHAQSERFSRAWTQRVTGLVHPAGRNHFSVVDDLRLPEYELTRAAIEMFGATR